jgi:hypothetical protein
MHLASYRELLALGLAPAQEHCHHLRVFGGLFHDSAYQKHRGLVSAPAFAEVTVGLAP